MKPFILLISSLLFVLFFAGCSSSSQNATLKNSTGQPNQLVIVVDDAIWKGTVDSIFSIELKRSLPGLPQSEPIFDFSTIPPMAFSSIIKTSRNLLLVYVGEEVTSPGVYFDRNKYAHQQAVVSISSRNKKELLQLFTSNHEKITGYFLTAERERLLHVYTIQKDKVVTAKAKELFGLSISIPKGFQLAASDSGFFWVRHETAEISQGIFIYATPYTSDSNLTLGYLSAQRNIVLGHHVPGPVEGSFMITEPQLPLVYTLVKKEGRPAAEMRGLWKVENDFMGGPFISLSFIDASRRSVITVEGYVYAPGKEKRNLLRQVEAIVYSVQFDDQ
jgi:hypothetical protein